MFYLLINLNLHIKLTVKDLCGKIEDAWKRAGVANRRAGCCGLAGTCVGVGDARLEPRGFTGPAESSVIPCTMPIFCAARQTFS